MSGLGRLVQLPRSWWRAALLALVTLFIGTAILLPRYNPVTRSSLQGAESSGRVWNEIILWRLALMDYVRQHESWPQDLASVAPEIAEPRVRMSSPSPFVLQADVVRDRLLQKDGKPKMVYWLTLNSHLPYVSKRNGPLRCGRQSAQIANKIVCELSELWLDVFAQVNQIAASRSLPPTDILVVGDHHTPLWERDAASHFSLQKVDWFLLRDQRKSAARTRSP